MTGISDYNGRRIIIYGVDSKSVLADTVISALDKQHHIITVSRAAFTAKVPSRVSVIIFSDNALHEYLGTVRGSELSTPSVDIALFKGKAKEYRVVKRYEMNRMAKVKHFVIAKKLIPLPEPLDVMVMNLSTSGCLLRANTTLFNPNTTFALTMEHNDTCVVVQATVVRCTRSGDSTVEYGCRFDSFET